MEEFPFHVQTTSYELDDKYLKTCRHERFENFSTKVHELLPQFPIWLFNRDVTKTGNGQRETRNGERRTGVQR